MRRYFDYPWLLFLGLLILFVGARVVGPRIADDEQFKFCAVNVHITKLLGVSLNCDSPEFMRLATDPAALLEPGNVLQAKPGMIFAAYAVGLVVRPLTTVIPRLVQKAERKDIDPGRISHAVNNFGPAYVGYVAINIGLLIASFYLLLKIVDRRAPWDLASSIVVVSVSGLYTLIYPVTNWVLTPHTEIFNTFVPLLTLYYVLRISRADTVIDRRFFIAAGLVTGLGILAYGLFYIVLPCIGLAYAVRWWRGGREGLAAHAINFAVFVALCLLPMGAWYAFVRLTTGQFHYHEVQSFNTAIWVVLEARKGLSNLVDATVERISFHWFGFLHVLTLTGFYALLLAGFVFVFARDRWPLVKAIAVKNRDALLAALGTSFLTLVFYTFIVGQFQVRHSYAAIPPLVAGLGIVAMSLSDAVTPKARNAFAVLCALFVAVAFYFGATAGVDPLGRLFD